jgi:hypothetical protein
MFLMSLWWRGGHGLINGGTRALELAMVNPEAAPRQGAHSPSINSVPVAPSRGARDDMTHAGGRSRAKKRLGEAVVILTIIHRRKTMYGGLFGN